MSNPATVPFEVSFRDARPVTGNVSASLWEVANGREEATDNLIRTDHDWIVRVRWSIAGALASCLCGDWALHLYMEPIDRGPEFHFPENDDIHVKLDPCKPQDQGRYWYEKDIRVPAGTLQEEHTSVPYKPVVSLTYRDVCGRPGPMAGFLELPTIQFVRSDVPGPNVVRVERDSTYTKYPSVRYQTITLVDEISDGVLTPSYLLDTVAPYLAAIEELQQILTSLKGEDGDSRRIRIRSIHQYFPLSIVIEGVADAINAIADIAVPSRNSHWKKTAALKEQETEVAIQKARAEAARAQAQAAVEDDIARVNVLKEQATLETMILANEKAKTELHKARLELALSFVEQTAPHLEEREKIEQVIKLLQPLAVVVDSTLTLEIGNGESQDDNDRSNV